MSFIEDETTIYEIDDNCKIIKDKNNNSNKIYKVDLTKKYNIIILLLIILLCNT